MAESDLQASMVRFLNAQIATVARVNGPGPAHIVGDPDIYGVHDGIAFQIEAKTEHGKLTPAQEYRLDEWQCAGARTLVARSLQEVKDFFWRELFPYGISDQDDT